MMGVVCNANEVTVLYALIKPGTPSKVPPKYRNPADTSQTWAGRGMPPKWLSAELARGKKLEDFAIRN